VDTVQKCDRRTDRITITKTVQRIASHGNDCSSSIKSLNCSMLLEAGAVRGAGSAVCTLLMSYFNAALTCAELQLSRL